MEKTQLIKYQWYLSIETPDDIQAEHLQRKSNKRLIPSRYRTEFCLAYSYCYTRNSHDTPIHTRADHFRWKQRIAWETVKLVTLRNWQCLGYLEWTKIRVVVSYHQDFLRRLDLEVTVAERTEKQLTRLVRMLTASTQRHWKEQLKPRRRLNDQVYE